MFVTYSTSIMQLSFYYILKYSIFQKKEPKKPHIDALFKDIRINRKIIKATISMFFKHDFMKKPTNPYSCMFFLIKQYRYSFIVVTSLRYWICLWKYISWHFWCTSCKKNLVFVSYTWWLIIISRSVIVRPSLHHLRKPLEFGILELETWKTVEWKINIKRYSVENPTVLQYLPWY